MKRNIPAFLSGALTTALVGTIAVSALAVSGRMTIEVDPINVQVNGEVFQPTDANGNAVPVFVYQGTTYAPLRALAEAYGLEVGYDATSNMATVGKTDVKPEADLEPTPAPDTTAEVADSDWSAEDEAAYQEFKDLWNVECIAEQHEDKYALGFAYEGQPKNYDDVISYWNDMDIQKVSEYVTRWMKELLVEKAAYTGYGIDLDFRYGKPIDEDYVIFATVDGFGDWIDPIVHKTPYKR